MRSKLIACALLISVSSTALADPKDYKFQAVSANMAPDGMTDMTSMVIPVPRTLIVDLVEIESGLDRDAA